MPTPLASTLLAGASRLRHPTLARLVAVLFLVDLFLPDPVPFLDEFLLGATTLLLANWRQRKAMPPPLPGA